MKRGDPVWYQQQIRGGYGYDVLVIPAVFVAQTPRRVTIDIRLRRGGTKRIHVAPGRLTRRIEDREYATLTTQPTED